MEGKEVRFGIAQSALFTTVTTSFTTGTVNNMHDTLTPLGGMVPLLHMSLNCVFGGKGVGLMNMILYAILAVFICGLMVGRTPEYLGKKIEGREMKLTALAIIIHPLLILAFSALAVATATGQAGITNSGFHGLSQVLYGISPPLQRITDPDLKGLQIIPTSGTLPPVLSCSWGGICPW